MYNKDEVVVSVGIAAYNAENYIGQCLDNILNQKTNFKFVILINDDCSTDNTAKIIEEYSNKYPEIIQPVYQKENQYSQGNSIIHNFIFPSVKTKYFTVCDGDDYWCDEYKLQKQVDFMEAHPDYALCYHPAKMIYVDEEHEPVIIGLSKNENPQSYYELLKSNYITAGSIMYKFKYIKEELHKLPKNIYPIDWFNHIIVAKHGKIGYLPDVMYVYRWHSQGISHTNSDNPAEEIHLKYGIKEANFTYAVWNKIKDRFPQYYNEIFIPTLKEICITYIKNLKFKELATLQEKYCEYCKNFDLLNNNDSKYTLKYKKYKKLFNIFLITSIILSIICSILIILLFI